MNICANTIGEELRKRTEYSPNATAFIFDDVAYSWRHVHLITNALAAALLEKGVTKGSRVGLWGDNTFHWVCCFFALQKIGAPAFLINYSYKEGELAHLASSAELEYLLLGDASRTVDYEQVAAAVSASLPSMKEYWSMRSLLEPLCQNAGQLEEEVEIFPSPHENDTSCVLFTSGTTSVPKGVQLSHYSLLQDARVVAERMRWTEADCQLLSSPFFHCSGLTCGILVALCSGMCSILMRRFQLLEAMKNIEKYRCTVYNTVPSALLSMFHSEDREKYDLSSLVSGTLAGSGITPEQYLQVCKTLGFERLQTAYGQTETAPLVTLATCEDSFETCSKTVGTALPGIDIRIWDAEKACCVPAGTQGEIQVKGFCVMNGYLNQPEMNARKFTEDGWLRTGDIGYFDENDYLHFVSRSDDIIIRNGENISPQEIIEWILRFDDRITAVKVVGIEAEITQAELVALVSADAPIDTAELRIFLRNKIANYKVPKYMFQVPSLPLTTSGKIDGPKAKELAKALVMQEH